MHLELAAMYQLELYRAFDLDRRREMRDALRRGAAFEASELAESDAVGRVSPGDRARRGSDLRADLGRSHDLGPRTGGQKDEGRLVRIVKPQSEP
jgi:hypothetical protein